MKPNLKIKNPYLVILGSTMTAFGMLVGGTMLARGFYLDGGALFVVLVFAGGLLLDKGFEKRKAVQK